MKQSVILSALGSAAMTYAHGIVSDMTIGGVNVGGYNPFQDPYMNPAPERIVWAFPDAGNGPVEDVSSADIVCNKGATAAKTSQTVAAGADVTFMWTVWPESHKGPAMTYMAACPGADCSTADPTTLDFFKIHHAGLNADGSWASDDLIANNNSLTVTLPSDIKPGAYLLRHELLALHSAGNANGAQFYPMCANLVVEGSGTAEPAGVKFPGAYKADDAGILVSIYNGLTSYTIPGPAVYGSSDSSPAPANPSTPAGNSTAPAATSAAPETSAPAATTSLVPEPVATEPVASEPAASAPAATSAPGAPTSAPVSGPTTMQTVTRPAATGTATNPTGTAPPSYGGAPSGSAPSVPAPSGSAPGGYDKTPEGINKCLDEVNRCIARTQSQKGNGFSKCESQRASCY